MRQRAKPRCALKSTDTRITSPSPSKCGALPIKDSGSRRSQALIGSLPTIDVWNQQDEAIPAHHLRRFQAALGATSKATMCPEINKIRKLRSRPQDRANGARRWPGRAMENRQSKVGHRATDPPSLAGGISLGKRPPRFAGTHLHDGLVPYRGRRLGTERMSLGAGVVEWTMKSKPASRLWQSRRPIRQVLRGYQQLWAFVFCAPVVSF